MACLPRPASGQPGEEVPTRLPTGTVLAGDLGSLNAVTIESDRTRYLSSLTEEIDTLRRKGEQQGNKIGVGNQPTLMIDMFFQPLLPGHTTRL